MEHEVTFRIVLERPPAGILFGLQKGRGSAYETIQKQLSKSKDLSFEFKVRVSTGAKNPTLLGPFVQGPPDQRFVYIDIGTYAGQTGTECSRRLKVPLSGITRSLIEQALAGSGRTLETRVPGTGRDGGPNCATVKPFDGWKLTR